MDKKPHSDEILSEIMQPPWPPQSKMVSGTSWLDENPQKFLFSNPNPLVDGMIAQVSGEKVS
jgi:hypothetical protein